jgi:transcription elongation factor Elf1
MNAFTFLKISEKYNNCPECGSDKIGNGEGTLTVEDDTYTRTCKCGFEVAIKEGE